MIAIKAGREPHWVLICIALLAIAAAVAASFYKTASAGDLRRADGSSVTVPLPPPMLFRPISPKEAVRENASRSFVMRADSPAAPFRFSGDGDTRARALQCLAQVVYYEAAGEGAEGERAVAQVVLNRVRHPGFPPTICGVVYQGSDAAGCQFTFTCDGSLARLPSPALWIQARQIASEELSGKVFAPVGHATHYHADYVLPYWADSLDKSVQIGHHIFYRLKGALGASVAFTQTYARTEPPPLAVPLAIPLAPVDAVAQQDSSDQAPSTSPDKVDAPRQPRLLADISSGSLIADGDAAGEHSGPAAPKPVPPVTCSAEKTSVQLHALAPSDLRATPKSCAG